MNGNHSAFACPEDDTHYRNDGLTKREYIATMVLAGMWSNPHWNEESIDELTGLATVAADRLIEALAK